MGTDYKMENLKDSRRSFLKKIAVAGATTLVPQVLMATSVPATDKLDGKGLTILFQGDSITDGKWGRNQDLNHIMGHGYAFSIASRVGADHPDKNLLFINRGISGNKVTDLEKRWQTDTLDLKPDVLSVLVGVNDAASVVKQKDAVTVEKYEETYRAILDQTKEQNPEILLVLCEPFILPVGPIKEAWDAWHPDIVRRQETVKQLATDYNAVFVPFQKVFDKALQKAPASYWIWDGVHPTVAGHELMAREWMKQVKRKLRFIK